MELIRQLAEQMEDEICDSKHYAKWAVEVKETIIGFFEHLLPSFFRLFMRNCIFDFYAFLQNGCHKDATDAIFCMHVFHKNLL